MPIRLLASMIILLASAACQSQGPYSLLRDPGDLSHVLSTADVAANFTPEQVARGQYMVQLAACSGCHTNGALMGTANAQQVLTGSDIGIAWTNPLTTPNPGVVYPANLTPDVETGIGSWTTQEIVRLLQTGFNTHSGQTLPVMPWANYSHIHTEDAIAIAAYLKSLKPVKHKVPSRVRPGENAAAGYVHFGIGLYQSK